MNDQNEVSKDLRRSARQIKRVDYNEFNQTGVIKEVQFLDDTSISNNEGHFIDNTLINNTDTDIDVQEISNLLHNFNILSPFSTMDQEKISQLQTEQATSADDINDFLDENNLDDNISDIEDIESCISRIEQLRSKYRRTHKDLSKLSDNYEINYGKEFLETIASIKCYIKEANRRKGTIQQLQKEADVEEKHNERKIEVQKQIKKNEACQFHINEINQLTKELNHEFKIKPDEIEDEHLLQMENEIKENNNKMGRLSSRIKNLLSLKQAWDLEQEEAIRNIYAVYQRLITRKNEYCTFIKEECSRKELSKEESFKTSNLKIKLQKFRGYESSADIYTFRSEFEKVYSRSTPRRILPDVLKNNFLEDPALSLVKSLDNINEI